MTINPSIRNITVSGRIGCGSTTLAKNLSQKLSWNFFEGGELFEQFFDKEKGNDSDRPDDFDLKFEEKIKDLLKNKDNQIIQSHLAGFDAQGIQGIFKILLVCEDENGDIPKERAKRLVERKGISTQDAEKEIMKREEGNLKKWRRLYAENDPNWVHWDKKYYDLIINTYYLDKKGALDKALQALTEPSQAEESTP